MEPISRANDAYALLEHSVAADRSSAQPLSLGLLSWQIVAGMLGIAEVATAVGVTLWAPSSWFVFAVPGISGALLLTSVFSRHRWIPGVLGVLGNLLCAAALVTMLRG
jgi:hypothetical protein